MTSVHDLETPIPVVHLDVLESNLAKMQAYCDRHHLRLRPHIKTHKSPEIAHMQLALGAVGITCQKLGEAEVMRDAGIDNIHLSYPIVGVGKMERLAALAARTTLSVSVDSDETLLVALEAADLAKSRIGVWIDFDSGARRTGVPRVEDALRLAQRVVDSPDLKFGGLITYPLGPASSEFFAKAVEAFDRGGLGIPGFSGAGTPTAWLAHMIPGLTEVRQGSYVFHDRNTVGVGAASLEDCAVHVWSTVVSRPTSDRAILDCGSKSLSSDRVPEETGPGYGLIREYPDAVIERLYEEHALVNMPPNCAGLRIGERVRVLPNHVCVVVNLHDVLPTVRGNEVVGQIEISARGKSR